MYSAEVPSCRNLFKFGVTFRFKQSGRKASNDTTKSAGSTLGVSSLDITNVKFANKNKITITFRIILSSALFKMSTVSTKLKTNKKLKQIK